MNRNILRKLLYTLMAIFFTTQAFTGFAAETPESPTKFCWKTTWVTDASKTVIPDRCGPNEERNGLFCYEKCRAGYTSNRIDGCVQNCPAGATDDGLFCGWPSYKAEEFPAWDKTKCFSKHGKCWQTVPGIGVWVEYCKPGYHHVLGFCEKNDINCGALGLKGNRIANSCAKDFYTRPPKTAGCPPGTEFSAGLCYASCSQGDVNVAPGAAADRVGFVCWGKCPANWVNCGLGCAKTESDCRDAVVDQVVSVVDSVASTTLLIGSMGASAAGKNIMSKAAWKGIKQIGKAAAKDVLKGAVVSYGVNLPSKATKIANNTIDYIWNVGSIMDNTVMTKAEKDYAIAQLALNSANLFDPTGVTGVAAAYTKPTCNQIAAFQHPATIPSTQTNAIQQATTNPPATRASKQPAGASALTMKNLVSRHQVIMEHNRKRLSDTTNDIAKLTAMQSSAKDAKTKKMLGDQIAMKKKELESVRKTSEFAQQMYAKMAAWQGNAAPATTHIPAKPHAPANRVCAPARPAIVPIDTHHYYRLATRWQGDGKSLDIVNDGKNNNRPILAKAGNYSGQLWKFTPVGGGYYRLSTMWRGNSFSLDIVNDGKNNNRPILAKTGNYSGQMWKLTPLGGGYFRFTTKWQGDCKSLDIINDGRQNNQPVLANGGNYSGQMWKLTKTNVIAK